MYLSQLGWPSIEVWDKLCPPRPSDDGVWGIRDRSYNNVLKGKAQAVLHELGIYDRVIKCCAPDVFRQEWTPQNPDGKRTYHKPSKDDPFPQACLIWLVNTTAQSACGIIAATTSLAALHKRGGPCVSPLASVWHD